MSWSPYTKAMCPALWSLDSVVILKMWNQPISNNHRLIPLRAVIDKFLNQMPSVVFLKSFFFCVFVSLEFSSSIDQTCCRHLWVKMFTIERINNTKFHLFPYLLLSIVPIKFFNIQSENIEMFGILRHPILSVILILPFEGVFSKKEFFWNFMLIMNSYFDRCCLAVNWAEACIDAIA